jgi:hypothetical protein
MYVADIRVSSLMQNKVALLFACFQLYQSSVLWSWAQSMERKGVTLGHTLHFYLPLLFCTQQMCTKVQRFSPDLKVLFSGSTLLGSTYMQTALLKEKQRCTNDWLKIWCRLSSIWPAKKFKWWHASDFLILFCKLEHSKKNSVKFWLGNSTISVSAPNQSRDDCSKCLCQHCQEGPQTRVFTMVPW